LTARAPIKARFPDFADLLASAAQAEAFARLHAAESIGRPLGDARFRARVERLAARRLRPGPRGPETKRGGKLKALSPKMPPELRVTVIAKSRRWGAAASISSASSI